jgi:replication-associated recombination protein RarA
LYDKAGEEHYNLISALHKSMRNSDPDAAVYWLARMLEAGEDSLYIARRLVRFASEMSATPTAGLPIAIAARKPIHRDAGATRLAAGAAISPAPKQRPTSHYQQASPTRCRRAVPVRSLRNAHAADEELTGEDYRYARQRDGVTVVGASRAPVGRNSRADRTRARERKAKRRVAPGNPEGKGGSIAGSSFDFPAEAQHDGRP